MTVLSALYLLAASVATGILLNIPRLALVTVPPVALAGYALATAAETAGWDKPFAIFAAAFTVALMGEWLARRQRLPALVLSVPAIIPLVPGSVAYAAMAASVAGSHALALEKIAEAGFSAAGIASGLLLASALMRRPDAPRRGS